MFGSKSSGDKWPIKYLSEIVDPNCPISYGIVQPGDELEDGVPIVRPVDLNSNYYVYKNGLKRTTEAISNSYKRTILRGDELLLCVRGTTGVMGLATEELKGGNVTRGITPLYFKDGFNRIYLLGAFLSDDVQAYIKDNTVGSTLKGINMERVRKIQIPIPPIEIQNKWEEVFKQADKSKFMRSKSQFIEMFGDQNINSRQWPEGLVKDEFKLSMGKTPARNNPACWEDGTNKWISISDMASYTRYTGDTNECITDFAIEDSGIKAVPKGTIIMSFKLSIGRTAITSEDIYTNEAIMAFADFDKKKFNIDFLHFLIANKNWLLGAKQAVKGQTLNKESIGNAKIIIPPLAIQEEFARIYNQADKSKFMRSKSQFIEMFGTLDNHPAEYAVKTLRDLSECYAGATPSTKVKEYWDNGSIPWMSSGEVHMEHVTETESKITESGYQQTSTKMVPVHSVVIALAGQGKTRGKVAITVSGNFASAEIGSFSFGRNRQN